MVRFGIQRAALAALYDYAMRIMMSHIHQQRRLAPSAAIGLVAATFAQRRTRRVLQHVVAGGLFGCNQDQVELRHGHLSFRLTEAQRPALSTLDFFLPAEATLMYRCAP